MESTISRKGLEPVFLRVAPVDIALIKFIFESYESVAVVRTLDRRAAVIVVLVAEDFRDDARGILDSLAQQVAIEEIPAPPDAGDDWLLKLLWEKE